MSREELDDLLEAMPKIAEAVNSFEAADLQRDAFSALLRAYGVATVPPTEPVHINTENPVNGETQIDAKQAERRRAVNGPPRRTLIFGRTERHPFRTSAKKSNPAQSIRRTSLPYFGLSKFSDVDTVDVGKVLAAYKSMSWMEPSQPDTRLRNTASKFHWIDTSDMASIKTTPGGRNMVNQMPVEKVKKK